MAGFDDDFGELYAGSVDVPVLSAVNSAPQFDQSLVNSSHKQQIDSANIDFSSDDSSGDERLRMNDDKLGEEKILGFCDGGIKSESENEDDDDDDDDDFVVVVNRDEDVRENVEVDNVVSETNLIRNARGGDVVGNLTKPNCGNSQYKYMRRLGSVSMCTERATGPRRVDKDYSGRFQQNSIRCRVQPAGDGSTELNFGDLRNGFCLPWYRTIVDVDIDSLEQKPWTNSGADMTDYFNFGFNEGSWRSYCQSLDQLRHQSSFNLARNQGYRNLRCNPVGASKQLDLGKFAERDSDACGQRRIPSQELCLAGKVGQPIHVEDSNFERQPSMVSRPPRICDSDVIIEVTLQEPEEPSKLPEEPDDKLEVSFDIVEKRCEQGKLVRETQLSGDLKANKMREICVEENVSSPTQSSDLRRSYEPAAVSNGTSCTQTQRQNTESDSRKSGKMYTLSGGNQRAPNIAKDDADSDRDSIATNPCVAGLDLLSDEADVQSSDTSSYSLSEESNGDYYNDSIKTRSCGKSSPESVVVRSQVVRVDYHGSRDSKRGDTGRKGSCHKYHSRVRSSTEEDLKSSQKNFCRHSEMKNHTLDVDIPKHVHASSRSRFLYEDEERRGAANFINDDAPSYWEKSYSSKGHYKHFMKNQLHDEWKENSYRQDHWGFRDDISSNTRRRWDDDQHCSERTRRMRGDMNNRDRDLDKREFVCRRGNHFPHNEPHSRSKYCASADINWQSRYGDYHDDRLNKTSKHAQSEEYRYSDMSNRYADSPLYDWQREHMESEIEHQRHLNFFGKETRTFDRRDNVFEQLSSDYSRFIKDDNEYHNEQAFPDIYDYHDEQHVHAERWGYSSLSKDDADIHQTCNKNERNCGYLYAKKRSNVRRPTDSRDAYDRDKCQSYLDHDDFFVNGRYTSQSEGMDWQDDALLESNIYNDVDEMFNSVNGIRRRKLYGAKNGLVSNDMLIYAKGVKDDNGVICAGGKSYNKKSKILTRVKHERTGWRCRNSVGLRDFKGNKSCGSVSKPGTFPNNDARSRVGDFEMHLKEQPLLDEKSAVNEALKVEKSLTNHCHLEDGQILTDDVRSKKFVSGHQKSVNQNVSRAYDESRILATMAKMEKRRERFKQPILVRKDGDDIPNPQVVKSAKTVEFKAQRPTRKRQWGWNLGV